MNENLATILIVEDEQAIRRFVRSALEAEGFRVCEADGVQRGLIEAATRKPDLVVLDLGLPDGDGQDFIRDLRLWSPIPVIVLSARVDETDKVKALDAGADDYLIKPFGIGELLARIRVALRRRGQVTDSPSPLVQLGDVCTIWSPGASLGATKRSISPRLNFVCWVSCWHIPTR